MRLLSSRWVFKTLFIYVNQVMFPVVFTWHNFSLPLPLLALALSQRGDTTSQHCSRTWFSPVFVLNVILSRSCCRGETCLLRCCFSARGQGSRDILSCCRLWASSKLEVVSTPLRDFARISRFSRQLSPDEPRASATHQDARAYPPLWKAE